MTPKVMATAALFALAGCDAPVPSADAAVPGQQTDVEHFTDNPQAPYSSAVRVGNVLYLSGKLGVSRSEENGIQPETRRVMERIRSEVEQHGSSMGRVFKCTVMLADMAEWGAMNEVYREFFPEGQRPARSAFGVGGLAANARVEIECMAAL